MRTIDGHTFSVRLFTGSCVIDAGCRGFEFARQMMRFERTVYAIDIEDFGDSDLEYSKQFIFRHAALMAQSNEVEAHYFGNGTGNFVKGINEQPYNGEDRPCETKKVKAITLQDIYKEIGTDIDLLKLDIEGSEYEILANLEPIPKQVTVEFHEHCHPNLHSQWIDKVLQRMDKNYVLTQYPCPDWPRYKFMDCLFIRKDLL
jgi:FkbM family methyltransferase